MTARSAGAGDRRNDARERLSTERVGSAERSAGDGLIVDAADRVAGDISSICFYSEPLAKLNVIYGKVVEIYMVGLLVFKSEVQQ